MYFGVLTQLILNEFENIVNLSPIDDNSKKIIILEINKKFKNNNNSTPVLKNDELIVKNKKNISSDIKQPKVINNKCIGFTKNGNPCKRFKVSGSDYCQTHSNKNNDNDNDNSKVDPSKNTFIYKPKNIDTHSSGSGIEDLDNRYNNNNGEVFYEADDLSEVM